MNVTGTNDSATWLWDWNTVRDAETDTDVSLLTFLSHRPATPSASITSASPITSLATRAHRYTLLLLFSLFPLFSLSSLLVHQSRPLLFSSFHSQVKFDLSVDDYKWVSADPTASLAFWFQVNSPASGSVNRTKYTQGTDERSDGKEEGHAFPLPFFLLLSLTPY